MVWLTGFFTGRNYIELTEGLTTVKIISFIVSVLLIAGVVYCVYRILGINKYNLSEVAKFIWEPLPEERAGKWDIVKKLMASEFQRDWKQGIARADALLEEIIVKIGHVNGGFDENLARITSFQLKSIKQLREAHQVAVRIAGMGDTYEITKEEADGIIAAFEKSLNDLGYI